MVLSALVLALACGVWEGEEMATSRMTTQEGEALLAAQTDKRRGILDTPDPGPESNLQKKINLWCRDHGYHFLSFRKSRNARGFLVAGHPDVTIFMPEGRTVLIELKDGRGRLSKEQLNVKRILKYNKHEWYEVRSYRQFLTIVGGINAR